VKYYPWDEKLSRDHFLACYASAVQAIIVCLSADMIKRVPHFDVIEMSEDTVRIRGNKHKLLSKHCHYDVKVSRELRCLIVPNFIKKGQCVSIFFQFFKMVAAASWIIKFLLFYWLMVSGEKGC